MNLRQLDGKLRLILYKIPIDLEFFLQMYDLCLSYLSLLSSMTPKNLDSETNSNSLFSSMMLPGMMFMTLFMIGNC